MKYESTLLKQMLAAEYVVGTLVGGARRRFRRLLAQDRWLRGEVRYWEQRFAQLGVFAPVPPRELVWAEIQRRLGAQDAKVVALESRRPQPSMNFWRAWSGLATAATLVLAVLLVRQPEVLPSVPEPPRQVEVRIPVQTYVGALQLPNEAAQWTVSLVPDTRMLRVIAHAPSQLSATQDYQLWWLTDEGVVSLGLLPRNGASEAPLPLNVRPSGGAKVAVSLEPAGGSRSVDGPSGPVLLAAPLMPSI